MSRCVAQRLRKHYCVVVKNQGLNESLCLLYSFTSLELHIFLNSATVAGAVYVSAAVTPAPNKSRLGPAANFGNMKAQISSH